MSTVHFRYRIFKDAHDTPERAGLGGINLQKPSDNNENWLMSNRKLPQLERYIRTREQPSNLRGPVEYEEYDPITNELLFRPYPKELPDVTYTRNELATLTRPSLIKLARDYGINTVSVKEDGLVRKILEEQEKIAQEKAEPKAEPAIVVS